MSRSACRSLLFLTLGAMVWVGNVGETWGAGVFFVGNGVRSAGKAGAVVATGNHADMFIHNPANLSRLRGFGLRFDNTLTIQTATFKRAPVGSVEFGTVSKKDGPSWIPALSFWYGRNKVGPGALTLQLFAHGPHGRSGYIYPEEKTCRKDPNTGEEVCTVCAKDPNSDAIICDPVLNPGPNRNTLVRTNSLTLYFGLAAAYEIPLPNQLKLRLGGTFRVQYVNAVQRQALIAASNLYNPASKSISTGEVLIQVNGDGVTFTGDLGATLELPMGFSVGASIMFPATATLNGELDIVLNKTLSALGVSVKGKALEVETSFPMFIRAGVGWSGFGLTVELSYVGELWGTYASKQKLRPKGINLVALGSEIPVPEFEIDLNFHDAHSIRLGAEYNILNYVLVRAGFFYDTGAIDENKVSVATVDYPNKIGITGGVSFRIPKIGVMLDFSVVHILGRDIKVTDSPLRPTDATPDNPLLKSSKPLESTSNGDYTFGMTGIFLGIRGNWGANGVLPMPQLGALKSGPQTGGAK